MKLLEYTTESGFLPNIKCDGIESAVAQLVERLNSAGHVEEVDSLVAEVMRRELEGSTAIGGGLAIPHARLSALSHVTVSVATLEAPIQMPAEDGRPVDVVILLVGPDGDPRLMLRVLARLARLVKQSDFLDGLRAATRAEELREVFAMLD